MELDSLLLKHVELMYRTGQPGDGIIGYQRGEGYRGTLFTIILSKGGIKLGVPFGATLADPAGLLTGNGKVHRHVPITQSDQLRHPQLLSLIDRAVQAWEERSASHS